MLRAAADQRRLGAPQRVGSILTGVQPDEEDSAEHDPRGLPRGEVAGGADPAWEEKVRSGQLPLVGTIISR